MNLRVYLLVLFFSASVVEQTAVPPILEQAMPRLPGVRLLDPTVDLVGGYTVDELKSFGYWPPWITTDVDRDGFSDVVSVVVKPGATRQFGVIAVHARDTHSIQWVTTLGERPIYGVTAWPTRDTAMPLFCVECDSNNWYRWSGRAYEADLYAVGERDVRARSDARPVCPGDAGFQLPVSGQALYGSHCATSGRLRSRTLVFR